MQDGRWRLYVGQPKGELTLRETRAHKSGCGRRTYGAKRRERAKYAEMEREGTRRQAPARRVMIDWLAGSQQTDVHPRPSRPNHPPSDSLSSFLSFLFLLLLLLLLLFRLWGLPFAYNSNAAASTLCLAKNSWSSENLYWMA